jgi:polyribonucleotide nucleotidyltransferase
MLNNKVSVAAPIASFDVELSTGEIAKQANGSVVLKCGDLVLLATAVMSKSPKEGIDFFPLTIEYVEKMYASGKIPGGFFKREARPSITATLTARLIDRPIRPLFPKYFFNDVQIAVTVLSYDIRFSPEAYAIVAASAALSVSDIPFLGPVGAATVGYIDGQFVVNPTFEQQELSSLHIVVAGTKDAILMVEAGADEVSEDVVLKSIQVAHESIRKQIELQEQLASKAAKAKAPIQAPVEDTDLFAKITAEIGDAVENNLRAGSKQATEDFLAQLETSILEKFVTSEPDNSALVKRYYSEIKKDKIRKTIIVQKIRPDGRALDQIRPIESQVGLLPSVHGSALFTRGETQSIGSVTLGTVDDEQIEDGLNESTRRNYYFHYNFPPYSVGEVGNMARTGRRELGHGALAERALRSILPKGESFPYTVRIVSDITESNGSSSMASVCSGTLALMDCGVPIKAPVSGIAMGLLIDKNGDYVILSDIQGLEDHYGDMDFKVAGTKNGITALQLDIKVGGLSNDILTKALAQALKGRLHILETMLTVLDQPRLTLSPNAPKIETITIDPEKVGLVIGPGGRMIRKIEEESKAAVVITDGTQGLVCISAKCQADLDKARDTIRALVKDIEPGDVYQGKVVKITNFGAFIEILPGKEGLLHISTLSKQRIDRVEDVLSLGQVLTVKVKEIDAQNRVNFLPVNLETQPK